MLVGALVLADAHEISRGGAGEVPPLDVRCSASNTVVEASPGSPWPRALFMRTSCPRGLWDRAVASLPGEARAEDLGATAPPRFSAGNLHLADRNSRRERSRQHLPSVCGFCDSKRGEALPEGARTPCMAHVGAPPCANERVSGESTLRWGTAKSMGLR